MIGTLALAQVRFKNALMPPTSLSWMSDGGPGGEAIAFQLDDLDATSLDVIAHWLLVAPDSKHTLFPFIFLSLGCIDEPHFDTVPYIIPFLKDFGKFAGHVELKINRSLGRNINAITSCPCADTLQHDVSPHVVVQLCS